MIRPLVWAGGATVWLVRAVLVVAGCIGGLWLIANRPGLAVVALLLWVLPVLVGYRLTRSKERPGPLALSLFLGWIGVLVGAALPAVGKRCPACDETIRGAAVRCRYCGWTQAS